MDEPFFSPPPRATSRPPTGSTPTVIGNQTRKMAKPTDSTINHLGNEEPHLVDEGAPYSSDDAEPTPPQVYGVLPLAVLPSPDVDDAEPTPPQVYGVLPLPELPVLQLFGEPTPPQVYAVLPLPELPVLQLFGEGVPDLQDQIEDDVGPVHY